MEDQVSNDKTPTAGHSVSLRIKLHNFLNKYALLILAIFAFTFFLAALTFVAVSSVIGLFKYNYSPVNNDVHSIISTHRRSRRNEDIIDI